MNFTTITMMNSEHLYGSSLSIGKNLTAALDDATNQLRTRIPEPADLLIVFAAGYSPEDVDREFARVPELISARNIVGSTCQAVISGGLELETESAVTMWAASFDGAKVDSTHLDFQPGPDGGAFAGWPDSMLGPWPDHTGLIVLGEPFGFPVDGLIERLNEDRLDVPVIGGMASGATAPGQARLLWGDSVIERGGIVIRISPEEGSSEPVFEAIVSQGCRPLGEKMVVTAAERNVIKTLGGELALDKLKKLFATLPANEQRALQHVLQIGRVINEYQDEFEYGDFLIRNVIGIDGDTGFLSVGDFLRTGQTVQFHIRDPRAASEELKRLLKNRKIKTPAASLLFSCNGRGCHMFPEPHHDAATVRAVAGEIPQAGFFAAGEIGPVGGKNFLHGYTACAALFR